MKLSRLFESKKLILSAEVFPPKKSGTLEGVIRALKELKSVRPDFVSVTCGAGGSGSYGTADVASVVKDAFEMEAVAHLTCVNLRKADAEAQLEILRKKGIDNVLVLRGDVTEQSSLPDFAHASDLAAFLKARDPSFHLLGACYPEGHPEAPSLKADIDALKRKVDSGVDQLITQLFFDNDAYFRFYDAVLAAGIRVPIQAGIMPIVTESSITRIVRLCGASVPAKFSRILAAYKGEALRDAGLAYAQQQMVELIAGGVAGIHLYTMNSGSVARHIFDGVRGIREAANA